MRVSHDVDSPGQYAFLGRRQIVRRMLGDVMTRRDPVGAYRGFGLWRRSRDEIAPEDPSNSFDWIMDVSDRHGLTSAFYFICGRTDAAKDALYDPEYPAIRRHIRHIHDRGREVGLHPSYNTYLDPAAIAGEASRLRAICAQEGVQQAIWGGRMHYLRWRTPVTLKGGEMSGFDYDSSLGYADLPGFRCGTCFENPGFDPVAGSQSSVRIRPLIAMDVTVWKSAT